MTSRIFGSVFAIMLAFPALAQETEAPAQGQNVLAVFAHPDDEVTIAPMLAHLARTGTAVTLVYATSGDAGPGVSDLQKGPQLAAAREAEALCAAQSLGVGKTVFLRLGDGTLGIAASQPDSPARNLAASLTPIIHEGGFDRIITWGPDGGYGHSDHRMVSAITTQIVQAMQGGRPALLYPGIRKGSLPPVPEMQDWAETDPELLTHDYSYEAEDLAAAAQATACHATQFDDATRAGMMALFDQTIWQGAVHLRPALPDRE